MASCESFSCVVAQPRFEVPSGPLSVGVGLYVTPVPDWVAGKLGGSLFLCVWAECSLEEKQNTRIKDEKEKERRPNSVDM